MTILYEVMLTKSFLYQTNSTTAPEKVKNASTVDNKIIRAIRPLSALKRSAKSATLLALGSAATSTTTVSAKRSSGRPRRMAVRRSEERRVGKEC